MARGTASTDARLNDRMRHSIVEVLPKSTVKLLRVRLVKQGTAIACTLTNSVTPGHLLVEKSF
jgi:hypothetical protein